MHWNSHTGLPASVYLGLSEKVYNGNAEQAARSFLADNAALFGFTDLNDLKYVKTKTHRGIRHVTFNQTVKGIPVHESEYQVHLRPNGHVDMANGTHYPNIKVSTSPSISESRAVDIAESDIEIPKETTLQRSSELVIYREKEQFHLAWKLILFSEQPIVDWLYMIDAQSGEILQKSNRLMDVTGDGDTYPTHPGISSVTNKSLYRLDGNGYLEGVYVDVENDDGAEAYSSSNSFQYSSSNTHFDEVNLYYHVDDFRHNFIEGIDDGSLGFTNITAHAHAIHKYYGDLNAWFSASSKDIYFGDAASSGSYNDFAKEDKVIHHEYGHAVIYDVQNGIMSSNDEEGAISEGTPDYWAGSHTGRSEILDYAAPSGSRDMDDPYYSDYSQLPRDQNGNVISAAHDGGEFFSAILWDLRSRIVADDADFLTYDALYRITGDPDFFDFRNAMIAADAAVYDNENLPDIQNTFADWGLGTHLPPEVNISGPSSIPANSSGKFTATVTSSYSSPPYSYQWYYKEIIDPGWTPVGSNSNTYTHYTDSNTGAFRVRIEVTYANSSAGYDEYTFHVN